VDVIVEVDVIVDVVVVVYVGVHVHVHDHVHLDEGSDICHGMRFIRMFLASRTDRAPRKSGSGTEGHLRL